MSSMPLIISRKVNRLFNVRRYGKYAIVVILAILIGVVGALGFRQLVTSMKVKETKIAEKVPEEIKEAVPTPKVEPEA